MSVDCSLIEERVRAGVDHARAVRGHVAAIAAALTDRLGEVTLGMRDLLLDRIQELDGDPVLLGLLGASIEGNVVNILRALQYDLEGGRQEPPTAALEYARRLAQRGIPVNALVRSYWLGQQFLLRLAFDASQGLGAGETERADAYDLIVHHVFDYIDWTSQRVVAIYQDERQSWMADHSNARSAMVRQLLDEDVSVDVTTAENVIGYRLSGHHVAVVAWAPESRLQPDQLTRSTRMIRAFAAEVGVGAPLVVGCDQATAWAWVPVPRSWSWDPELARRCWGDGPAPLLALGGRQAGPEGFRRSHEQALQVQRTASLGGLRDRTLVSYDEPGVAPTALLSQNLDITRAWIRDVLGDLAHDDQAGGRLRRTLLTFLGNDMNYTATAEAMVMHKNSIKYRVNSAKTMLGHSVADNRLSVELALTACEWLGPAVLTPAAPTEAT